MYQKYKSGTLDSLLFHFLTTLLQSGVKHEMHTKCSAQPTVCKQAIMPQ